MLFLAALFAAIAVLLFVVEFFRPGTIAGMTNLALGFLAGSWLCYLLDILNGQGKI